MGYYVSREASFTPIPIRQVPGSTAGVDSHAVPPQAPYPTGRPDEIVLSVSNAHRAMFTIFGSIPGVDGSEVEALEARHTRSAGPPSERGHRGDEIQFLAAVAHMAAILRHMEQHEMQHAAAPEVVRAIPHHVLTKHLVRALGSSAHTPDTSSCTICCRTFEEILTGDGAAEEKAEAEEPGVMLFPCHHVFCTACATRWLKQSEVCPNCRHSITECVTRKSTPSVEGMTSLLSSLSADSQINSAESPPSSSDDDNEAGVDHEADPAVPQWWKVATQEDEASEESEREGEPPAATAVAATAAAEKEDRKNEEEVVQLDRAKNQPHSPLAAALASPREFQRCSVRDIVTGAEATEGTADDDVEVLHSSSASFSSILSQSSLWLPRSSSRVLRGQRLETRQWTANGRTVAATDAGAGAPSQRRLSGAPWQMKRALPPPPPPQQ